MIARPAQPDRRSTQPNLPGSGLQTTFAGIIFAAIRQAHALLDDDPPGITAWRQRMGQDEAKVIFKERAATAECANAQARKRGLTQFLVRGMNKAKAVALWYALTHNMVCTWRLVGV